jgi:hypothetical protein
MNRLITILLFLLIPYLTACVSSTSDQYAEGGIGGTGVSDGSVSGFGSVFVNGVEFETGAATILIDGQSSNETALHIGQYVTVEGQFNPPVAERITYVETLKGPVDSINPLRVMGQTVLINNGTVFSNMTDVAIDLAPGDEVEVSGPRQSNGDIVAGYFEKLTSAPQRYTVIGAASNVGATNFHINRLRVNIQNSGIQNGQIVRIKGLTGTYIPDTGNNLSEIDADSAETYQPYTGDDELEAEIEGFITSFTSATDFAINDIPVDAVNAIYEQGSAADLGLDVEIEVEGYFNALGILVAEKIILEKESEIILYGDVTATTNDSLILMGLTVLVNTETQMEDESTADVQYFDLGDINTGNQLEVRAYQDAGSIIASRVERNDPDTEAFIQGPVDVGSIDDVGTSLSVLGVTLDTEAPTTSFEDTDDSSLTETEFYNQVAEGDIIRAVWNDFTDTTATVDKMEFEN